MNNLFEKGECVRLNSGSPIMTVKKSRLNKKVRCRWFFLGEVREDKFSAETLYKVTPNYNFTL